MEEREMQENQFIYKICPQTIWQEASSRGIFEGAGIDQTDGFIHFSTAGQVEETARLHFKGVAGLVLVKVRTDGLDLAWEASRGGELFPHLYSGLEMRFVVEVAHLPLGADGLHIFPKL